MTRATSSLDPTRCAISGDIIGDITFTGTLSGTLPKLRTGQGLCHQATARVCICPDKQARLSNPRVWVASPVCLFRKIGVLSLWWSNHLDLHRGWSQRRQFLRHALKNSIGTWSCHLITRHWRTTSVMRKVPAIDIGPRTVHWSNRLSFGAETMNSFNSAEVRRRCPRQNRPMFV